MRTRFCFFLTYILYIFCGTPLLSHEAKIQAVIFDFGGVLGFSDRDIVCSGVAEAFSIPIQEVRPVLSKLKQHLMLGGDEKQFWEKFAISLGKTLPDDWLYTFRILLASAIREVPGSFDIVKGLQNRGYTVALLSNVRKDKAEVLRKYGYYAPFYPVLLSCDIGYVKPDPKVYTLLLETLNLPKDVCLFVDNKLENVLAAQKCGIDSILFRNSKQLLEELAKRKVYP